MCVLVFIQGQGVCWITHGRSRDISALPAEPSRATLASTGANGGNAVLNRMALVGRLWHNARASVAPPAGACMPVPTRCVTLAEQDMLAVAQIARPWWRRVRGRMIMICDGWRSDVTAGEGLATEFDRWVPCYHQIVPL